MTSQLPVDSYAINQPVRSFRSGFEKSRDYLNQSAIPQIFIKRCTHSSNHVNFEEKKINRNIFSWIREKSGNCRKSPKKSQKFQHDCEHYEQHFRNNDVHLNSSNRYLNHHCTPSPEFSSNDPDAGFRA